jgi:hypothetical protein
MGFLDNIRRNMPGSPKNIANNIFNKFLRYRSMRPDLDIQTLFEVMLCERHPSISDHDYHKIISESNDIIAFTLNIIFYENSAAISPVYIEETCWDIVDFFRINAPHEFEIHFRAFQNRWLFNDYYCRFKNLPNPPVKKPARE